MEPYCLIDGIKYELKKSDCLRFPKSKEFTHNLNQLYVLYRNDEVDIDTIFKEYVETGSSFDLVYGYFTKYGSYNGNIKKKDYKEIILFSGDKETDDEYNLTESDKNRYDVEDTLVEIVENGFDILNEDLISELQKCIDKLKL